MLIPTTPEAPQNDLIAKAKRILEAVDTYHDRPDAMNRAALRAVVYDELETAGMLAVKELGDIVKAKRFDRSVFDDDTAFADWAQSRARYTLAQCSAALRCESVSVTLTENDRSDLRVAANIIDRDGPSPIGVELSATLRRIASAGVKGPTE